MYPHMYPRSSIDQLDGSRERARGRFASSYVVEDRARLRSSSKGEIVLNGVRDRSLRVVGAIHESQIEETRLGALFQLGYSHIQTNPIDSIQSIESRYPMRERMISRYLDISRYLLSSLSIL